MGDGSYIKFELQMTAGSISVTHISVNVLTQLSRPRKIYNTFTTDINDFIPHISMMLSILKTQLI